ncbi:hypothetical protein Tco_0671685 [Tanacetum coccineum]
MFKVFNRCLTTRTFGHDQTKINIQQLFHDVVNRTNVDYAALLWWDFINCVFQKKEVFRYPRFTKLIIADSMKKFPSIPQRLNEYYHSIKDDILLVSAYSTRNVLFQGMLIPDAFLTDEIRATGDYKEYETGKKRKQSSGETSLPRKSLKVTIRQKKHNTTLIPPPSDDKETDEIAEATLLSLTLHKTALVVKAQETIAKVQEKSAKEEIEKIVEGEEDDESYASEFADSMLSDDVDDSGTRIEPRSHKENLEVINDDDDVNDKDKQDEKKNDDDQPKDDDVEKTDDVAKEKDNDATGNKKISKELTTPVSPTTATTSKFKSKRGFTFKKTKILPGSIDGMCGRRGQIRTPIKTKFVTHEFFMGKIREVLDYCNNVVPELTVAKTNEIIKEEMPRLIHLAVKKD